MAVVAVASWYSELGRRTGGPKHGHLSAAGDFYCRAGRQCSNEKRDKTANLSGGTAVSLLGSGEKKESLAWFAGCDANRLDLAALAV
ncbi:hypothetical protein HPB50_016726 [Hyalomma asiaticum]|uniref:Uncharacterized protein n=1 Tax=Hyalomma asiaticum TaxID=266040 RepID=A0ACB7TLJ9_HYAAI|nr:hypothetical protein HPB50_016726 [Hyalomma asiaticum]